MAPPRQFLSELAPSLSREKSSRPIICAFLLRFRSYMQGVFDQPTVPNKRVANDHVKVIVTRAPAENLANTICPCHERSGIARPPAYGRAKSLFAAILPTRSRRALRSDGRSRSSKLRSFRLRADMRGRRDEQLLDPASERLRRALISSGS